MTSSSPAIPVICSTGSFWMWELERTFGVIAEAGFDAVELMVTRDPRTQSPEIPRRLAAKNGLRITAVHAPMLVITRRVWGPNFKPIIDRSVELAKKVGADVVVVHPPYLWELKYQAWLIGELDRQTAEHGVSVAVENMFRLWIGTNAVRGHRWVSPSDLQRFTQITLDTSHCGVDEYDILEALEKVGNHLSHVHLSDSHLDHRDNHALPGEGRLPLVPFLQELKALAYKGAVSLELDMREVLDQPEGPVEALRRARKFTLEQVG
ncbi:MAG: sugar phosphate isomerase/epimerase [Actinobacteria bacterium]|nr:sugar phosphate isomerase/epimerase [Actinomycetota bacterium]